ncbi:hypothetical protein [Actinacidiphila rubida]|uniref:Uncharacterized protein n=1 Tax=Actinacidiphila rubida TaxID=310780 RepID=A0A1H8E6M0_9ACTN|nr:hypothetical protein [Actinacidiphila rubida]SEN14754.1 hypothetical protein SAMN05216267_100225 [Actinacidiphila rubida]
MPSNTEGLRVTVDGDLPPEVLNSVADAVRQAALERIAELDLSPHLREWPLAEPPESMPEAARVDGILDPLRPFLGIILKPDAVE